MKRQSPRLILAEAGNWPDLAAQANYRVRALVNLCGVSRRGLERYFRSVFRKSPQQWLDEMRQSKAEEMHRAGCRTKEIAYSLGYKDQSHFCHMFKKFHGVCLYKWKRDATSAAKLLHSTCSLASNAAPVANRQSLDVGMFASDVQNSPAKPFAANSVNTTINNGEKT